MIMKTPAKGNRLLIALFFAAACVTLRAQDLEQGPAVDGSRTEAHVREASTIAKGKALFAQQYALCHSLAQDAIGPPLGGITTLLTVSELMDRIRDPAKFIAGGDARANALLRRYKVVMPSFAHLAPDELAAILAFIDRESTAQKLTPFAIDTEASTATAPRLLPPVEKSVLVIELEDVVQIPRLTGRTPYMGRASRSSAPIRARTTPCSSSI